MSARYPRFEIVRGDHGWHARFRTSNGAILWATEVYSDRRGALAAIHQIAKPELHTPWPTGVMVQRHGAIEVRDIDARTGATP